MSVIRSDYVLELSNKYNQSESFFDCIINKSKLLNVVREIKSEKDLDIEIVQFIQNTSHFKTLNSKLESKRKELEKTNISLEREMLNTKIIELEKEVKNYKLNILLTASSFVSVKNTPSIEEARGYFFNDNVEKAITSLDPEEYLNDKLLKAYDQILNNGHEFLIKAQLTSINLNIESPLDRFDKSVEFYEKGSISILKSGKKNRNHQIDYLYSYSLYLDNQKRYEKALSKYNETINIALPFAEKDSSYLSMIAEIYNSLSTIYTMQNKYNMADRYFESLSYVKAAESYKALLEKDSTAYVLQRLGDCYYLNSEMEEASKWYGTLFSNFETDSINSEYLFKYGQALRGLGNYKESDEWIQKFSSKQKDDARGKNFTESNASIENLKPAIYSYEISNLASVNTERSDFGATFYKEGIMFASARPQSNFVKRKHTWNNRGFLDLYSASLDSSLNLKREPIKELNSIYHESSVSFSPDGKTIYFTRNNSSKRKLKKDKKGISNLKLYKAEWIDDEWQNIMELPFNSDEYSVGHPAVSTDGKKLFFVSDMTGSVGQTDIFYVTINDNNSFGPIQTLGVNVNTEGREMFPYVENNQLYFSSDGHYGLGGLDVFVSQEKDGQFQVPMNLKEPINSQADDFAFVSDVKKLRGFVSSNREGGVGDDDIYSFTYKIEEAVIEKKPCKQQISGIVVDKKFGVPLTNAKIVLTNNEGNTVSELITGASGKFSYFLPCNESYKITASKEYYKSDSNAFKTTEEMSLELDLDFDLGVIDEFTYNDRDELMIRINPIFFDYNKDAIRADAAQELDRIVNIMNRYSELTIESTSHTDARGRASYNESLSDRRAKSTVRYIISKGISESRISGKGYGESKLTNGCTDNDVHTNRVKCSKEEHQANRRSEFLITNISELGIAMKEVVKTEKVEVKKESKQSQSSYTVKAGDTLYSIATKNGLTVERLKELNNLADNNIAIGQVLKLK